MTITATTLKELADLIGQHYHGDFASPESTDSVYKPTLLSMTDEWGWGDGSPWIGWEEGPYQWSMEIAHECPALKGYLDDHNLRMEACNSWSVHVYEN